jgi:phosphonate transport system ATP-binding protein
MTPSRSCAVPSTPVVQAHSVSKSFAGVRVLNGVSLRIEQGEMVALIGASGSGKSTLIRTIAGLTPADRDVSDIGRGEIFLFSQVMQQRGRIARSANALRARMCVVFQQFILLPRLPALNHVCLGQLVRMPQLNATFGQFSLEEKRRAMRAMARVGIAEHALKRGCDLSGGQQQRAAIARALMQGAEFIVADEPIASLDPNAARKVMDIFADLNRLDGITVLVSLHQVEYALRYCPRTIALRAGKVVYDGPSSALTREFLSSIYGAESDDLFAAVDARPLTPTPDAATLDPVIAFDLSRRAQAEQRQQLHS